MKASALKAAVAELESLPLGTTNDRFREMQSGKLISKGEPGRYGGVTMTNSDRVNALLACIFDPPRGQSRVAYVKRFRRFELSLATYNPLRSKLSFEDNARAAFQFIEGLGIMFEDLGHALDGIVGSMRTDAFAVWEAGVHANVAAEFHGDHTVSVMVDRPQANNYAIFKFEPAKASAPTERAIERIIRFNRIVFEKLAANDETAPDQG
ncbi:hypothetical protein [Bradyrhizobium zhanjiangense]|nr:hypothetical protein [Bradyrhizobium zhanjiangense]